MAALKLKPTAARLQISQSSLTLLRNTHEFFHYGTSALGTAYMKFHRRRAYSVE